MAVSSSILVLQLVSLTALEARVEGRTMIDALRVFLRVVAGVGVGDLGSRLSSLPIGLSLPLSNWLSYLIFS